jgi:hypothetical protein
MILRLVQFHMAVSRSRYLVSSAGTFSRVELQNETVSLFFNATEFGERPWTRLRLTVERPGIAARTYSAQHECQFTNNHIVRFSESVRIPVSLTLKNCGGSHFISILRGAGARCKHVFVRACGGVARDEGASDVLANQAGLSNALV